VPGGSYPLHWLPQSVKRRATGSAHCQLLKSGFEDLTVWTANADPTRRTYTVVNRYTSGAIDERDQLIPTFVKLQCMHCQDPACVSACIVGALTKKENGAVHYDVKMHRLPILHGRLPL
jgi:Fe-S-cluster-containing dehydrogenase component